MQLTSRPTSGPEVGAPARTGVESIRAGTSPMCMPRTRTRRHEVGIRTVDGEALPQVPAVEHLFEHQLRYTAPPTVRQVPLRYPQISRGPGSSSRFRGQDQQMHSSDKNGRTAIPGIDDVTQLLEEAVAMASFEPRGERLLGLVLTLIEVGGDDPEQLLTQQALSHLQNSYERGWQPLDIVHAARRTSRRMSDLARRAVIAEAQIGAAEERAPAAWLEQLRALPGWGHQRSGWLVTRSSGSSRIEEWIAGLQLVARLRSLHTQPLIGPPPSRWDPRLHRAPVDHIRQPISAKIRTRIRALLAKAEATDYPDEAEAFTAKAQDLMTRHSIDEALLHAETATDIETSARRVHVDDPYAVTKAGLLSIIGETNRVRVIWDDRAHFATLVGTPVDLEQVEMLFVSLLIQATRAMTEATGRVGTVRGGQARTFRRSFLSAYAVRIGERLVSASTAAAASYGTDLVPVFTRQQRAVDDEMDRLFPKIIRRRSRATVDPYGWQAGTAAADRAVFPAGRIDQGG